MSTLFFAIKSACGAMHAILHEHFTCIKTQKGVTMVEYALIAALIAIVAFGTLTALGANMNAIFSTLATSFP